MNPWEVGAALPEWGELQFSHPVRQGDVLTPLIEESDPWRQLLIVLTADCDLARAKHGGALTCVPVLPYEEYLRHFVVDRLQELLCERLLQLMLDTHREAVTAQQDAPQISGARLRTWVAETTTETIVESLGLAKEHAARFTELAEAGRGLTTQNPRSLEQASRSLARAKLASGDVRNEGKAASWVAGELTSSVRKLPGDALFMNEVSPEHREGYVAYLRRVVEVNEEAVVTTTFRIPAGARYLRISRLRPPYV